MNSLFEAEKFEIRRARYKSLGETRDGLRSRIGMLGTPTRITVNRILNTTGPSALEWRIDDLQDADPLGSADSCPAVP